MRLTSPEPAAQQLMVGACLAVSCVVAALPFAAAEDITTGSEPGFLLEWLMMAFAAVWFLAAGAWARKQRSSARPGPSAPLVVLSCLVAAFALAALIEITTGSQPGFPLEWLIVGFAVIWFLAFGGSCCRDRDGGGSRTPPSRTSPSGTAAAPAHSPSSRSPTALGRRVPHRPDLRPGPGCWEGREVVVAGDLEEAGLRLHGGARTAVTP